MQTLTVELPPQPSLTQQNLARWAEVLADAKLAGLPERIETDRFGHIIMSPPPSAHHGSYQFRIGALLDQHLPGGRVITECPISTADGVKAADVAWASPARLQALGDQVCFPQVPEVCVEILSPANTPVEIKEKTALYFDAGALEVWHCTAQGEMVFWCKDSNQRPGKSQLCPGFPAKIKIDANERQSR